MQRSSQQDQDAVVWTTTALPLGTAGLDLRTPTSPGSLTKLLNARFRDETTLERRSGYRGVLIQDGGAFSGNTPGDWVYGHGLDGSGVHHPIAGRGAGTFRYDGADMMWTGDRLLVSRDGEAALGQHVFWSRGGGVLEHGVPAYLPVQTDEAPLDVVCGDYIETCLTESLRVIVAVADEQLTAWVFDRATGALINKSVLDTGTSLRDPRVISSDGSIAAIWRDDTDLRISWWGDGWTLPSAISADCDGFEVALSPGGFHLLWREFGALRIGRYEGRHVAPVAPVFGTYLAAQSSAGPFALNVSEGGQIGVVYQRPDEEPGLYYALFDSAADNPAFARLSTDTGWDAAAVCFRLLTENGVVHASNGQLVKLWELDETAEITQEETRYRSNVASKSFRVGDEVFCWLRALNSETSYLVAGVTAPQVVGFCDREESPNRVINDDIRALSTIAPDPLNSYRFTWARPYTTGNPYERPANARVGDLNFMPRLSAVHYGDSVYLAGSNVRNWDGVQLGDAGFHDYPEIENNTPSQTTGGNLTSTGVYRYRIYAVRYNRRGERFQSPAITSNAVVLTGSNNKCVLTIHTVPCTNHDDVVFEVYRTTNLGTTYYLEGTVANSLSAATVTFESAMSDADLDDKVGDPHEPGVGQLKEIEQFGPLGCEYLAAAGDRLWGWGGQVPRGWVQFSKLKEPNEGAGFTDLDGAQEIDTQGHTVTSMAAYGDAVAIFTARGFQILTNIGPNNYGLGAFGVPQFTLTDGAVAHEGTALTPIGVVFWGADGPRLLGGNFQIDQICAPVRPLSKDMQPSGVHVDLARQEVVWFSEDGRALLWNFRAVESKFGQLTSMGRWAEWSGLKIAGVGGALVTVDGWLLYEDEDAHGDNGVPFASSGATGYIAPQAVLGGHTHVRGIGVAGEYLGPHSLRVRVYFDGSPHWTDAWEWDPTADTGLQSGEDLGALTPAQIDALNLADVSGQYATHKRTSQHTCRHFRVEWSDISAARPTYRLHELTLELGARGGMGRVPVGTFGG